VAPEASEKERRRQETMLFYGATTIEEFAGRFGMTGSDPAKTLKRYIEKGRGVDPPDLPPFQRPHDLAAWWRRMMAAGVMGKRVPDWMVLLEQTGPAAQSTGSGELSDSAAATAPPGVATPTANADHTPDFALPVLGSDASDGERQVFEFMQGWLDEMAAAKKLKDSKRFFRAWNEYKALNKELRAWQKDRQREKVTNGDLLEAEKEKEALGIIFSSMGKTFMGALDALLAKNRPELDAVGRRQLVIPYRDQIYSALKGTRFQTAVPAHELAQFLAA
jgi:hypothetical protein